MVFRDPNEFNDNQHFFPKKDEDEEERKGRTVIDEDENEEENGDEEEEEDEEQVKSKDRDVDQNESQGEEQSRSQGESRIRGENPDENPDENENEDEEENIPEYMRDEAPKGKTAYVKWALLHGQNEQELTEAGHNAGTIRVAAQELEREGLRKRPNKNELRAMKRESVMASKGMQVFSKGSPPEAIINSLHIPLAVGSGPNAQIVEESIKFGMSLVVLGTRISQELSAIGTQQARPIIEMAKDMRAGELAAAKMASEDTAQAAAQDVMMQLQPTLADIYNKIPIQEKRRKQERVSSGENPMAKTMANMMNRTMVPMMESIMNQMLPPAFRQQKGDIPGWESEEEEEE
ncbi:MAG: hypothetical protein PHI12_13480 [Dehalococcoidales bacterium]|nr:hypothetical protein [Dehalococcoidales bacterium]